MVRPNLQSAPQPPSGKSPTVSKKIRRLDMRQFLVVLMLTDSDLCEASGTLVSVGFLPVRETSTECRGTTSCDAGSVPKSSSGPPRGASWVMLTTEGAQASTGALTSDRPL